MKVVFETRVEDLSDKNRDYPFVRIPGILSAPDGTLLAYYECRQGSDWSAIDIALRTSRDNGRTWSARRVLVSGKGRNTVNNPVMVADGDTIHFLYCENYKRLFYTRSTDSGESWAAPTELTDAVDAQMRGRFWSVLAVGPGHGIRTENGRLLVPIWFAQNRTDIFAHHPSQIAVLYSDDAVHWHLTESIGARSLRNPSECCIAEWNGRVLLNIRNENDAGCRAIAESPDGVCWNTPVLQPVMPDPVCCAGLCTAGDSLLFVNCASQTDRLDLTIRRFTDGMHEAEKLLLRAEAGYSDVCFHPQTNSAFVLCEQPDHKAMHLLQIAL